MLLEEHGGPGAERGERGDQVGHQERRAADRSDRDEAEDPGLVIEASDRGRWQPLPRGPGPRGRGLAMIRAVADRVDRVPTPTGTTITMTWAKP